MALEPITREEKYLAKAAGRSVEVPEPITRKEMFLDAVAKSGGGSSGGGGAQPDWDAVEGEPGYIQNRPFGKREVILFPETEVAFVDQDGMMMAALPANVKLEADTEYKIVYNEVEYLRKPCLMDGNPVGLGNTVVMGGDDTGEPFFIMIDKQWDESTESEVLSAMILALDGTTSTTVSCKGYPEKPLDSKYLPDVTPEVVDLEAMGMPAVTKEVVSLSLSYAEIREIVEKLKKGATLHFRADLSFNDPTTSQTDFQSYVNIYAPVVVQSATPPTVTAFYHNAMFVVVFNENDSKIDAYWRSVSLG